MSLEKYEEVLKFAAELGVKTIELCGGEPLISPYFRDMVTLAKEYKFDLILRTNGLLLDKYIDIADEFKWIGISLDGLSEMNAIMRPALKKTMTAKQQFERVINNIFILEKKDVQILLASVASRINYMDLINLNNYLITVRWSLI